MPEQYAYNAIRHTRSQSVWPPVNPLIADSFRSDSRMLKWQSHAQMTVSCSNDSLMLKWQSHAQMTVSCSNDSHMLKWQSHAQMTVSCSNDSHMLKWQSHAQMTVTCSNDSLMLKWQSHAQMTVTCSNDSLMLKWQSCSNPLSFALLSLSLSLLWIQVIRSDDWSFEIHYVCDLVFRGCILMAFPEHL